MIAILYAAETKLTDNHHKLYLEDGYVTYIRTELIDGYLGNLVNSKPMKDEVVLNSIFVFKDV